MTPEDYINGIRAEILSLGFTTGVPLNDTQKTELTDKVAEYLETVNPTHDYPPTPR